MAFQTTYLFGEAIDSLSMDDALSALSTAIKTSTPISVSFLNAGKFLAMEKDNELRQAVANSTLRLADGQSIVTALSLLDRSVPQRVTGIDLMMELLKKGSEEHYSFYFLGATDEVLKSAVSRAKELYPNIEILGSRNGYFKKDEEDMLVEEIKNSSADILFVGIASPIKETFIERHLKSLGVSVAVGVGGSFDVLSGKTKRASKLWQNLGLEWLYRVKQEPARMWKRYLFGNLSFLFKLFLALIGIEKESRDKSLKKNKAGVSYKLVVTFCFLLLFVKSLLFALALPPWMGNDEPNHFAYLMTLAGYGDEKTVERKIVKSLNETNFWKLAEMRPPDKSADSFNETDLKNHSENVSKSRSSLYYYIASIPLKIYRFKNVESALLASRLVSVFLSIGSLWLIYISAKIVFAESEKLLPITTLLFAGLHPQFSHITTVVNSDQLLILIFSLFFYLFVRFIRDGFLSTKEILLLLAVSATAILTKQHGVILLPLLYAGIYFVFRSSPAGSFKALIRSLTTLTALLFLSLFLLEYLAPLSVIKLTDRVALYAGYFLSSPSQIASLFPVGIIKGVGITFVTFWFTYGQMVHKMSYGFYIVYFLLTSLSLIGLVKGLAIKGRGGRGFKKERESILFSLVFVCLLFLMLVLVFFTPQFISRISGRYLFYAIAPISVLSVFGLKSLRAKSELPLIAFLLVMNFLSLFGYLLPLYY